MCLIAFAIGSDPDCPLLLAGNRDEFFERPTAALDRWCPPGGGPSVVAGRDLRDGGTWLGISEQGRVAMLTNVRSAHPGPGARSRGELPMRWLAGDVDLPEMQGHVNPGDFGGFNLVVGDLRSGRWAWMSNCHPDHPHVDQGRFLHSRPLSPGLYGLSNASLDTPWPKTLQLKSAVRESLSRLGGKVDAAGWTQPLTRALADTTVHDDGALPDTGLPPDWERLLSSSFVSGVDRGYGTRSSVVMRALPAAQDLAAGRWQVEVHEWSHAPATPQDIHRWNPDARRSAFVRC